MAHVSAAERRPQLIKAAIDLMSREGIAAGSTRAVAAELGVAQATLQYIFGTKKDLYRAVIEQLTDDYIDRVRAAHPDDGPFPQQVEALVHALWDGMTDDYNRYVLLYEFSAMAFRDPDLRRILSEHEQRSEQTAADLLDALADAHGIDLSLPSRDIAVLFLAGFSGLVDRHLLLGAGGGQKRLDRPAALDQFVAAMVGLCLGQSAALVQQLPD
ncbi:TetR/AcrR family transcriptional regulator [Kitasatospora cineracea]|uniref:TetR family transcriptional regulator n=1 Tax=Kitasatospora cineracea TaxID=88074 RepID=A0A8G1UM56_9ACTN|nr:TetR family transcriptional regulator [Kitasatospora cineracea]ROR46542.1 TetR family transcriptional regulator [Kitasatospora cineracea]